MPNGKPSKAFMNRYYAYVLSRMTYRDTALLEDHHVITAQLNMDFYTEMLSEVQENINNTLPKIRAIIDGPAPQSDEDKSLYEWLYELLHSMDAWLPPKKVRDRNSGSVAEFVLHGEFLSACINELKLDDQLMKKLNIDVFDRFYTLACRNALN